MVFNTHIHLTFFKLQHTQSLCVVLRLIHWERINEKQVKTKGMELNKDNLPLKELIFIVSNIMTGKKLVKFTPQRRRIYEIPKEPTGMRRAYLRTSIRKKHMREICIRKLLMKYFLWEIFTCRHYSALHLFLYFG